MMRTGFIISRYLVRAVLPYFIASWLLLSVILFIQQASRFSEIFFNADLPTALVWQLTAALIPNVISFTCPMAIIVGTVIGLAKLQTDSELVAMRAAGVGNLQIALPIALLGIVLSAFSFFVNLEGVPLAAGLVRRVAIETAIKKLESPIDPGIFNSEIAGFTILVRNGDPEKGIWQKLFIYKDEPNAGIVRLITADEGRIDFSEQQSELVLTNAVVSTLPQLPQSPGNLVSENLGTIRLSIKTRRDELVEKLSHSSGSVEELGLSQLSEYASSGEGRDQIEAQILWHRRILLSITPFLFSLLGTAMVLRFSRGGRGMGVLLVLAASVGFYLLAFAGEQLARTGHAGAYAGSALPVAGCFAAIVWLYIRSRSPKGSGYDALGSLSTYWDRIRGVPERIRFSDIFVDLTTGIRDFDVLSDLIRYFLLAMGFLGSLFLIFTAFDLWKYAGTTRGGPEMLLWYLVYLTPFVVVQLAAPAAMIATLATYVIKSRQNEIVTWTAAGQSIYRLLIPCLLASLVLGILSWQLQDRILPVTNQKQDQLRTVLVRRGAPDDYAGRQWVTNGDKIISYVAGDSGKGGQTASDNEKQSSPNIVSDVVLFEFDKEGALQTVYRSAGASWSGGEVLLTGGVEVNSVRSLGREVRTSANVRFATAADPFVRARTRPSYMSASEIDRQIPQITSDAERRSYIIAREKRYSSIVLPFVVVLFTAPFAFALSRKGRATHVGYAIALWLVFTAVVNVFEQFGRGGYLGPSLAVWSPLLIFALLGVYRLSRVPT